MKWRLIVLVFLFWGCDKGSEEREKMPVALVKVQEVKLQDLLGGYEEGMEMNGPYIEEGRILQVMNYGDSLFTLYYIENAVDTSLGIEFLDEKLYRERYGEKLKEREDKR